uniref:Uncharacterized protein n=1 Tax=Cacopsylla melanoneura TaxID=428564 RepID=A0A8D8SKD4_9HEMI
MNYDFDFVFLTETWFVDYKNNDFSTIDVPALLLNERDTLDLTIHLSGTGRYLVSMLLDDTGLFIILNKRSLSDTPANTTFLGPLGERCMDLLHLVLSKMLVVST